MVLESIIYVARSLTLKFHQNWVSNSWDIAHIEFVWFAKSFSCLTQLRLYQVEVDLSCGWVELGVLQFCQKSIGAIRCSQATYILTHTMDAQNYILVLLHTAKIYLLCLISKYRSLTLIFRDNILYRYTYYVYYVFAQVVQYCNY